MPAANLQVKQTPSLTSVQAEMVKGLLEVWCVLIDASAHAQQLGTLSEQPVASKQQLL